MRWGVGQLGILLSVGLMATPAAVAAQIPVTTTADVVANDGQCSLREAVFAARLDLAGAGMPGRDRRRGHAPARGGDVRLRHDLRRDGGRQRVGRPRHRPDQRDPRGGPGAGGHGHRRPRPGPRLRRLPGRAPDPGRAHPAQRGDGPGRGRRCGAEPGDPDRLPHGLRRERGGRRGDPAERPQQHAPVRPARAGRSGAAGPHRPRCWWPTRSSAAITRAAARTPSGTPAAPAGGSSGPAGTGSGGAIAIASGGAEISGTTFADNRAGNGGDQLPTAGGAPGEGSGPGGRGGALAAIEAGSISAVNSTFAGNHAGSKGAGYIRGRGEVTPEGEGGGRRPGRHGQPAHLLVHVRRRSPRGRVDRRQRRQRNERPGLGLGDRRGRAGVRRPGTADPAQRGLARGHQLRRREPRRRRPARSPRGERRPDAHPPARSRAAPPSTRSWGCPARAPTSAGCRAPGWAAATPAPSRCSRASRPPPGPARPARRSRRPASSSGA